MELRRTLPADGDAAPDVSPSSEASAEIGLGQQEALFHLMPSRQQALTELELWVLCAGPGSAAGYL